METVKIRIQSLEDAAKGIPAIEGVHTLDDAELTKDVTIAFLEGGQASGKTSVMIGLRRSNGIVVVGELTQDNFLAVVAAYNGAVQRFGK